MTCKVLRPAQVALHLAGKLWTMRVVPWLLLLLMGQRAACMQWRSLDRQQRQRWKCTPAVSRQQQKSHMLLLMPLLSPPHCRCCWVWMRGQ